MRHQIAVRLPDADLARLDEAVERGVFASRAEAVRAGLALLWKEQRDRQIAEEYRRAYAKHPQDDALLRAGATLAGEVILERDGATG